MRWDGTSLLVRANAVPAAVLETFGNSELTNRITAHQRVQNDLHVRQRALAQSVADHVVPIPGLSNEERSSLIEFKRDLFNDRPRFRTSIGSAVRICQRAGAPALATKLKQLVDRLLQYDTEELALAAAISDEEHRVFNQAAKLPDCSPVLGAILARIGHAPRKAAPTKKRRRYVERVLNDLTRASTDPTPRGWMSHVGISGVHESEKSTLGMSAHLHLTDSLHRLRKAQIGDVNDLKRHEVGLNPLHWKEADQLFVVVPDHGDVPACVTVTITPNVQVLLELLDRGSRAFSDVSIAFQDATGLAEDEILEILRYLCASGILEMACRPCSSFEMVALDGGRHARKTEDASGWLDVYRGVGWILNDADFDRINAHIPKVLQILNHYSPMVVQAPQMVGRPQQTWEFSQLLKCGLAQGAAPSFKDRAQQGEKREASVHDGADPNAHRAQKACAGSLGVPLEACDQSARSAGGNAVNWPLDILVRIGASDGRERFVLRGVWSAGVIDSRFADGLESIFGETRNQSAYRAFLNQIECNTGVKFAEILAPPCSNRADNATRRPSYTDAWIGDPHRAQYLVGQMSSGEYLAPSTLRLQSDENSTTCFSEGQRIWPVYHATRVLQQPWGWLSDQLLSAAPLSVPIGWRVPVSLVANSSTTKTGDRIVIGEDLVFCPAFWLLDSEDLWDPSLCFSDKIKALGRLREVNRLPRWVEVGDMTGTRPRAYDLDNIYAARLIEKAVARYGRVLVNELLPAPDRLCLTDPVHNQQKVMSDMIIRYPENNGLSAIAHRISALV